MIQIHRYSSSGTGSCQSRVTLCFLLGNIAWSQATSPKKHNIRRLGRDLRLGVWIWSKHRLIEYRTQNSLANCFAAEIIWHSVPGVWSSSLEGLFLINLWQCESDPYSVTFTTATSMSLRDCPWLKSPVVKRVDEGRRARHAHNTISSHLNFWRSAREARIAILSVWGGGSKR